MRTHSNIAEVPSRIITKQWDAAGTAAGTARAIGLNSPTLRKHSMGLTGKNGIVSFVASGSVNQVYTLYEWNIAFAGINSANGWMLNGSNVNEYAKTCDGSAKISFTCTESVPFYIKVGTTPIVDAVLSGTQDDINPNTDLTRSQTR